MVECCKRITYVERNILNLCVTNMKVKPMVQNTLFE